MQDMIPISVDDRRFTIVEWLGFLFLFAFFTLHFSGMATGTVAAIWERVWLGDFNETNVIWSIGLTIIAVPALVAFYGVFYWAALQEPFNRGGVLLDTRASHLILERRHITGFSFRKSLAFADVRDVSVEWTKGEDGDYTPELQLIPNGVPVHPPITNPADAADLAAFATRLRAELAAAGWSAPLNMEVHKGDAASGHAKLFHGR